MHERKESEWGDLEKEVRGELGGRLVGLREVPTKRVQSN